MQFLMGCCGLKTKSPKLPDEQSPALALKNSPRAENPQEADPPAAAAVTGKTKSAESAALESVAEGAEGGSVQAGQELFPDIEVEATSEGIEHANDQAKDLITKGQFDESARWFSKALWLMETQQMIDEPEGGRSTLHLNRSFAYIKLERWSEAEADCSAALELDPGNVKALYRRATARYELGKLAFASADSDEVLEGLPEHPGALELKRKISEKQCSAEHTETPADPTTTPADSGGCVIA